MSSPTPPSDPNITRDPIKQDTLTVGRVFARILGGAALLGGLGFWITYLSYTVPGFESSGLNGQLIAFGFFLWAFLWFAGTILIIAAGRTRKKSLGAILIPVGAIFVIVAIMSWSTGAQ